MSAPDRRLAARRAAWAQVAGAAAAMVAVPPRASELVAHLAAVADAAPGLELVLQDYPASGHEPVTAQALADAAEQVPAVVAVKAEDPPTPAKIRELRALAPRLRRLGGLGALWLLWELRAGADGTMTGFGYPELLAAVAEAALAGDDAEAQRLYELALPALVWESQPVVGLALRKALLAERGIIESRHLRAPSPAVPGARDEARGLVRALTDLVVP